MTEDMPGRMPEDMPVTKCINVMVGITRSKVILLWFFNYIHMTWELCPDLAGRYFPFFLTDDMGVFDQI